jgi:MFS family permease
MCPHATHAPATLADAMDRRHLLLAGNALLGVVHLALWLQAVLHLESVLVVLVLVLGQGVGFGATMTTMGAAVPRLVPADLLVAANGLSALARYLGAVVGPLLAGVPIPVVGFGPLYLCDALALGAVLWAVAALPAMPPAVAPVRRSGLGAAIDGIRYLATRRILVGILAIDLVFAFPVALFPELAAVTYGPSAWGCFSPRTPPACSWPGSSPAPSAVRVGTAR